MVNRYFGTPQTFAYLNGQLDYPPSRRAALHIITKGNKTLCGLTVGSSWEVEPDDLETAGAWNSWACKKCQKSYEKMQRVSGKG